VFKSLNKIENLLLNHFLVVWIIDIVHTSINNQNLSSLLSIDPILMFFMNGSKIIEANVLLAFSVPNFDPFAADFR